MWSSILAISLGAAVGANARWLLGMTFNRYFPAIPPGTLIANLLGAWLIGVAISFFSQSPGIAPEWRLFLITGMLGALTTFSTFSAEMVASIQSGKWVMAFSGIAVHVLGSLLMTTLGMLSYTWIRAVKGG